MAVARPAQAQVQALVVVVAAVVAVVVVGVAAAVRWDPIEPKLGLAARVEAVEVVVEVYPRDVNDNAVCIMTSLGSRWVCGWVSTTKQEGL